MSSGQNKESGIVIPPRYETLGRARPRGTQNNHAIPNPFQRVPPPSQVRQSYQQTTNDRMSIMSTSEVNYAPMNYGTVSRNNTQNSYYQPSPAPSPSMNPVSRQPLRSNRGLQMNTNTNNSSSGFYPVIPTRDISRSQKSPSSSIYRHTPSSSVTSFKSFEQKAPIVNRSNTATVDRNYRRHAPKNSISSLFSENSKIVEEPIIPLRGKGSLSSIHKISNIQPRSTNDLSEKENINENRTRSPSLPLSENASHSHHIRNQSYGSGITNNIKANNKIRSNSGSSLVTNSQTKMSNGHQTKSEDNVMSKSQLQNISIPLRTPVLNENDGYDSPVESPDLRSFSYSPNISANESFNSPIMVPTSPVGNDDDKKDVIFPPRRGYKTQSIYSNFSFMTTSGEVMEYQGIQSLDAIEEMLKNDAFNTNTINSDMESIPQLITQPIIEQNPAPTPALVPDQKQNQTQISVPTIVIPARTSASIHPKSSTGTPPSTTATESNDDSSKTLTKSDSTTTNNSNGSTEIVTEEEIEELGIINHSALLSEIAEEFINSIPLLKKVMDSIEYTESFSGTDAVNTIADLIGTSNRKLALAIGRSLESQLLFHDVLYTNELFDSDDIIYQLNARSSMRYNRDSRLDISAIIGDYIETSGIYSEDNDITLDVNSNNNSIHSHTDLPSGVFVAISSCYSPTCTNDSPCYSYSCPRRKAYNLKSSTSKDSKPKHSNTLKSNENAWSTTVGKNVLEKVDDHERKRQEVIYEFIQSEKEYVDDLMAVIKLIKRPLSEGIVPKIDNGFVNVVFSNIEEIFGCNAPFSQTLQNMQQKNSIIDRLGDITMEFVKSFTCYIRYGEIQPLAKEVLQYHKNTNSALENFLKQMQSKKEFRRLPLESFLARPTTRLGRYPILIKDILKHTKEDHPDQKTLKSTMEIIQNILKQVNEKAGKTTDRLKLDQWAKSLDQTTMEKVEDILTLRLNSPQRQFLREGQLLLKRDGTTPQEVDIVFLDNAFVITRKKVNTVEILKKPIPVQLIKLIDHEIEDKNNNKNLPFNEKKYTFSVVHMGYRSYTFIAKVFSEKKSWIETIEERVKQVQGSYIELFNIYSCHLKINTAVVVKDDIMIFANENGLFTNVGNTLSLILPLQRITTIDIMPDAGLLFVLIDKEVIPYSIDALLRGSLVNNSKKPRKLCSGISFMEIGFCYDHHLLCAVKTANTNSTIKSYEPNQPLIDSITAGKIKKSLSTIDVLIPHKQFYIPAEAKSIQFLKRALCVGCTKGFEVVDITTFTTQSLFDTHNPEYEWIIKAEYNPIKLIKTSKGDFIVCYNKVGFFLDKNGNPSRGNTRFFWLNSATTFSYISPYILAISNNYVEVWDENDPDSVKQIIYGYNIRLFTDYTGDAVYIISGSDMQLISRIILSRKRTI
jgi:hypothetical protein